MLHPFDRRFFGRHRVMPALGFGGFDSIRQFRAAPRVGKYVADAAVAARIVEELSGASGPVLVFAVTMQAHGPWPGPDPQARWLEHLRDADAMLGALADAAARLDRPCCSAPMATTSRRCPARRRGRTAAPTGCSGAATGRGRGSSGTSGPKASSRPWRKPCAAAPKGRNDAPALAGRHPRTHLKR
ncbi:hypothetical protein ACFQU7_23125 [Pseudoroseomonas wenyumeiae]